MFSLRETGIILHITITINIFPVPTTQSLDLVLNSIDRIINVQRVWAWCARSGGSLRCVLLGLLSDSFFVLCSVLAEEKKMAAKKQ